ncbi:hypothetical protein B0H14DRAFT_3431243 [Mycena olivaceomarginata]|nr:hypothetical protein B0H14DRAFT_3431243 [Mycena olivaceomarginata]
MSIFTPVFVASTGELELDMLAIETCAILAKPELTSNFADSTGQNLKGIGAKPGFAQQQQRANKRRCMSIDSASEPPSSAVSYSSYADG